MPYLDPAGEVDKPLHGLEPTGANREQDSMHSMPWIRLDARGLDLICCKKEFFWEFSLLEDPAPRGSYFIRRYICGLNRIPPCILFLLLLWLLLLVFPLLSLNRPLTLESVLPTVTPVRRPLDCGIQTADKPSEQQNLSLASRNPPVVRGKNLRPRISPPGLRTFEIQITHTSLIHKESYSLTGRDIFRVLRHREFPVPTFSSRSLGRPADLRTPPQREPTPPDQ